MAGAMQTIYLLKLFGGQVATNFLRGIEFWSIKFSDLFEIWINYYMLIFLNSKIKEICFVRIIIYLIFKIINIILIKLYRDIIIILSEISLIIL